MNEIISMIISETFLTRALFVGVLISLCSALLGVSLVLKRFSMIGDGLSHVGFGSMAIAAAANIAPLTVSLPVVIICAFLLLRMNEKGKIKGDAAIALLSTGALAIGVMVTSMTTGMNVDIYNYMFGSILTMKQSDVVVTAVLATVVIALFVIFYDEIFAVTFDESFAKATGTKVSLYNMLIASLTAVTIVIGMRMMGALLISSLIIFPSVTSMRLSKSYRSVIVTSCVVSVFCFLSGLVFSVKYEAPTGASVVCVNIFVFLLFTFLRKIKEIPEKTVGETLKKVISIVCCSLFTFTYLFILLGDDFRNTYKKSETVSVVATAFAQYDFARQIAGEKADITMLLSPGEESHTYEPTPADILKIKECDVFIYGGGESDSWVDTIISSLENDVQIVKMMDIVELHEEDEHAHDEDDNHSHSHEEHEEAEYDEHVWTSPENAILISEAICDALINADKDNENYYSAATELYVSELEKLSENFRKTVDEADEKFIVVGDRFPLMYLCEEYGISYEAAYPGCSAQVEANPTVISRLINKMNEHRIDVVFKVDLSTGLVAETISESTGAEVEILYSCHVISAEDFNNGETYISMMERNMNALSKALS